MSVGGDRLDLVGVGGAVHGGRVVVARAGRERAVQPHVRAGPDGPVDGIAGEVRRRRRCRPHEVDPPGGRRCRRQARGRLRRLRDRERIVAVHPGRPGDREPECAGAAPGDPARGGDGDRRGGAGGQRRGRAAGAREDRRCDLRHARERQLRRRRLRADVADGEDGREGLRLRDGAEGERESAQVARRDRRRRPQLEVSSGRDREVIGELVDREGRATRRRRGGERRRAQVDVERGDADGRKSDDRDRAAHDLGGRLDAGPAPDRAKEEGEEHGADEADHRSPDLARVRVHEHVAHVRDVERDAADRRGKPDRPGVAGRAARTSTDPSSRWPGSRNDAACSFVPSSSIF